MDYLVGGGTFAAFLCIAFALGRIYEAKRLSFARHYRVLPPDQRPQHVATQATMDVLDIVARDITMQSQSLSLPATTAYTIALDRVVEARLWLGEGDRLR